jgi:hypothetical protein
MSYSYEVLTSWMRLSKNTEFQALVRLLCPGPPGAFTRPQRFPQ